MGERVEVKFVEGNRKHKLAEVKGYLFERNRELIDGISYRCVLNKKIKCPAILHVRAGGSFLMEEHVHAPNFEKLAARKIISKAKNEVKKNPLLRTAQVISMIEKEATKERLHAVCLGETSNLKRRICHTRLQAQGRRTLAANRHEPRISASSNRQGLKSCLPELTTGTGKAQLEKKACYDWKDGVDKQTQCAIQPNPPAQ